jgi:hypothetical protein
MSKKKKKTKIVKMSMIQKVNKKTGHLPKKAQNKIIINHLIQTVMMM